MSFLLIHGSDSTFRWVNLDFFRQSYRQLEVRNRTAKFTKLARKLPKFSKTYASFFFVMLTGRTAEKNEEWKHISSKIKKSASDIKHSSILLQLRKSPQCPLNLRVFSAERLLVFLKDSE